MRGILRAGFITLVLSWGLIGESTPAQGGLRFSPGGDSSSGYQTLKPGLPPGSAPPVYTNPQPTPVLGPSSTAASINGQPASLTQAPINWRVVLRRESFQTPLRLEPRYALKNSLQLSLQVHFQKTWPNNSTSAPQDDHSTIQASAEVQREDQGLAELLRSDDARSAETNLPAPAPSQQGIWTVQQLADALTMAASLKGEDRQKAYNAAHVAAQKMLPGTTTTATLLLERNGEADIYGAPNKSSRLGKALGIPVVHQVRVFAFQSTPAGPMALVWYQGHTVKTDDKPKQGEEQFVGWAYISVPNASLAPRPGLLSEPLPVVAGVWTPRTETPAAVCEV